jgi:glycosyltransferase involved in cell wall biosynthesis
MVGEGPDRPLLEARIDAAGLGDRVHLAGHRRDVAAILAACDGAVLASRREGMPLSLLEALCHGLPAVACEVDGVGEVVEHGVTGLLVPPEDPAALARGLELFLVDAPRRARMGARARRRYEARHTLAAMTTATFAHYGPAFDAAERR